MVWCPAVWEHIVVFFHRYICIYIHIHIYIYTTGDNRCCYIDIYYICIENKLYIYIYLDVHRERDAGTQGTKRGLSRDDDQNCCYSWLNFKVCAAVWCIILIDLDFALYVTARFVAPTNFQRRNKGNNLCALSPTRADMQDTWNN